ncbi:NB-ARC domain-containing protein [candidate division KSB1 bacterium]|nr:NB-ARC domain-containing protein [candidate division KSB1 bacterium]
MIGNLNKIGITQVGAVGMGGIGKTQLAVEFAYRFSFAFDGIYWIQAADSEKWLRQFVQLSRDQLQLKIQDPANPETNLQYLFALRNYCKAHPHILIIMDNVDDPKLLHNEQVFVSEAGLTPFTLGANLLFTSRKLFQLPGVHAYSIDKLSPEAAYALLISARQPDTPIEEEQAKAICKTVGYLPLALVLAAGFLNKYRTVSFLDYHAELARNKLDVIDSGEMAPEELSTRHDPAVRATLKSQWDKLTDENAKQLFLLAALFPETAIIPKARLGLLAGIGLGTFKIDRPLEKAFFLLHELNLVEKLESKASAIRLHPLVRDFARRLIPDNDQAAFKAAAVANLESAYDDLARLESEYLERGIGEVMSDLQVALHWCEKNSLALPKLALLQNLLTQEQSHLIKSDPPTLDGLSPSFLQQLHHCAQNIGQKDLAQSFLATRRHQSTTSFKTKTASVPDHHAFQRHSYFVAYKSPRVTPHADFVASVSLSANGQRALSVSYDATLLLWDFESGQVIRTFQGHLAPAHAVLLSPDGRRALVGFRDTTLVLWDVEKGELLRRFGHSDAVTAVGLSADGLRAVSSSADRVFKTWNLETGEALRIFNGHSAPVQAISLSADGQRALSGSRDKTAIIWNLENVKSLQIFQGHSDWVTAVCLSADGHFAMSGSKDTRLICWDVQSGKAMPPFEGHSDEITSVSLSSDNRRAVSSSLDRTIILWDLPTRQAITRLVFHNPVTCLAMVANKVVVGDAGGLVHFLEIVG